MATASKPAAKKAAPSPAAKKTSTAVAVKKPGGAVVDIAAMREALRQQAAGMGDRTQPGSGLKISTKGKRFTLPDGTKTTDPLSLVILDFIAINKFYQGKYDAENPEAPACFAISVNPKNMIPSANSPVRQSDACNGCPLNEFKSADNGKGKACKNGRMLAVLSPDADEDDDIWLIEVSPTGLKGFDNYVAGLARMGMTPMEMITTVSLDEAQDYPVLQFSNPVPNENLAVHFARQEEAKKLLATEPDVSSFKKAEPPPAKKQANARR